MASNSGISTRWRRMVARRRDTLAAERLERRLTPATLSLVGPNDVLLEGEQAEFTLRLSERSSRAETVFVTTSPGTAVLGVDYMAPARQQILFAPGQTVQKFTIPTLKEAVPRTEGVETFFVTATPSDSRLSAPTTAVVRIADFQQKPVISVSDISVTEGNTGTTAATFTIRLNTPFPRRVSVNYATRDGSATVADADFVATSGSLEFLAGETVKTVDVNINGDRKLEANETFSLVLSAPVNANVSRANGLCTIGNDETDAAGFQIILDYRTAVQPTWKAAIERAAAKWSSIIVGDVPGVLFEGRFIDDFEIRVSVQSLGAGLLGYARTLQTRPGVGGLPFLGEMVMNSLYANQAGFYDTVAHELAHALGFNPTLWTSLGLFGGTNADPRFTGVNATREFNRIFSRSDIGVPLYEVGRPGDGSYGAHWRDSVFGKEMMVSAGDPNETGFPISRITVGSMADIGYSVNYAAADAYVAGGGARFAAPAAMAVAPRQAAETIKVMATPRPLVHLLAAHAASPAATVAPSAQSPATNAGPQWPLPARPRSQVLRPLAVPPASATLGQRGSQPRVISEVRLG